jgi:hypothetical protein
MRRADGDALDRQLGESLCMVSRQFAGSARVSRYVSALPATQLAVSAEFEGEISLESARVSGVAIGAGEAICVELTWTAAHTPPADYTVFVHLIDADGAVVAQSDLWPGGGYLPTSTWQAGQVVADRHGLIAPHGIQPGAYRLSIGLYDTAGTRLALRDAAGKPITDAFVIGSIEIRKR